MQMMGNPDPQMQAVLAHPENMALVKRLLGLEEFVIPDEESRTKQYREISQLVAEAPVVRRHDVTHLVAPAVAAANVASGAGVAGSGVDADVILPSVLPDEFADNHAVELEICMRWFSSDAGQVAKVEAPLGYANVRAHAMFHRGVFVEVAGGRRGGCCGGFGRWGEAELRGFGGHAPAGVGRGLGWMRSEKRRHGRRTPKKRVVVRWKRKRAKQPGREAVSRVFFCRAKSTLQGAFD